MKRLPEFVEKGLPLFLSTGDLVQFFLQIGGEIVINILGEMVDQKVVHHHPHIFRNKALLVEPGVFAFDQGVQDAA